MATTTLPYFESFVTNLNDCYIYSVSGDSETWFWSAPGDADCYGNDSGDTEEDWLVMQGINFDDYSDELMSFRTIYAVGGTDDDTDHYLKLFYSSDFTGTGDPTTATWTEMPFTHPTIQNSWASSGIIDVSSLTGTVYFAFVYRYTDNYRYWAVDDFAVYENIVDVTFQVDMSQQTVSPNGVHLVGGFSPDYNDWDITWFVNGRFGR